MKLEIVIGYINDNVSYNRNSVVVYMENQRDINSLLHDKDIIRDDIKITKLITHSENYKKTKKELRLLQFYLQNLISVEEFDCYEINFYKETNVLYYKELLESLDKKITIDVNKLSIDQIMKLNTMNFKVEPYIVHRYNSIKKVCLSEFIDTLNIIENIKKNIIKYDFSMIEQLIFIYDLVRDREYKEVDETKSKALSRNLSSVLKEDTIVCEGYANLFSSIANALGIKTEVKKYFSENKTPGHATNISYVNDEKYGFAACLEFDATADRKVDNKDYMNSYGHFGMGQKRWKEVLSKKHFIPINTVTALERINRKYDDYKNENTDYIKKVRKKYLIRDIKSFYELFKRQIPSAISSKLEQDDIDEEQIDSVVKIINKIYYQDLPLDIFGKAFYKVRRAEHIIDPNKYELDEESIKSVINSRKSPKDILIDEFFSKKYVYLDPIRGVDELKNAKGKTLSKKIDYDEKRMRLIRALKHGLKNKESEEKGGMTL